MAHNSAITLPTELPSGTIYGPTGQRYHPMRTPTSGLDANSSDEFIGGVNSGIYTWGNQGSASVVGELDTLRLNIPAGTGVNRRGIFYTPPSGDWVMTTCLGGHMDKFWPTGFVAGTAVIETGSIATPTLMSMQMFYRNTATGWNFGVYTATSYTAAYTLVADSATAGVQAPEGMIQIRYVSGTKSLSFWGNWNASFGYDFYQLGSTRILAAHPVAFGLFGDQNNVNSAFGVRYKFLRTRTDATGTTAPYPVGE